MRDPVSQSSADGPVGVGFDFHPDAPVRDLLSNPLQVGKLPLDKRPKSQWKTRIKRFLHANGLGGGSEDDRLRWKVEDAIAAVLVVVGAVPADQEEIEGGVKRQRLYHPYQLKWAFDSLLAAPESANREARFLELLLGLILKSYSESLSSVNPSPLFFATEAREFFRAGFRAERLSKRMHSGPELQSAVQQVHTAYFHGRNYYLFSLVRREKISSGTQLFSYYCRAWHFMARVGWDGELEAKPLAKNLPGRSAFMFHVQRDQAVRQRMRADAAFAAEITSIAKSLSV